MKKYLFFFFFLPFLIPVVASAQSVNPLLMLGDNGAQALANNTIVINHFNVVAEDNLGAWSTTTYEYTPQVAGYYHVDWKPRCRDTTNPTLLALCSARVEVNGASQLVIASPPPTVGATTIDVEISGIVYMNGSTDYLQFASSCADTGGTCTTSNNSTSDYAHVFYYAATSSPSTATSSPTSLTISCNTSGSSTTCIAPLVVTYYDWLLMSGFFLFIASFSLWGFFFSPWRGLGVTKL